MLINDGGTIVEHDDCGYTKANYDVLLKNVRASRASASFYRHCLDPFGVWFSGSDDLYVPSKWKRYGLVRSNAQV